MLIQNIISIPATFDPDDRRRRQILTAILAVTIIGSLMIMPLTILTWWPHDNLSEYHARSILAISVVACTAIPIWIGIRHANKAMDRQRYRILDHIMTACVLLTSINLFIAATTWHIFDYVNNPAILISEPITTIILPSIALLLISLTLLAINRSPKIPGWIVATIFIILLTFLLTKTDTPAELLAGRSSIAWVVPIVIGAMVLPPASAFLISFGLCLLIALIGPVRPENSFPNIYLMIELVFIAFISWLGMSIANRAIRDARREAANNQAVLNSIADGVLVLDLQGNFLSANPAMRRMIPEEELKKVVSKPLGTRLVWRQMIFCVTSSPVPEVGTVAVLRDETRRQETERARDALIATASHELRTPLTAIMNYLEMLMMLIRLDRIKTDQFQEHLGRALENSKRLQNLINDILDQAQIQAGMLELKHQLFDLPSLLEKTRQLLDTLLKQKRLSYELVIEPTVPGEISGDPDRLHQVLVNLIGNAIKFTSQGGIKVHVSAPEKKMLSIEVSDTGAGIPPEQLPDIFEAFRRGSDYAQRERQGAGLGLSIVKEIVTRMGGQVSATSQVGVGSTLTVLLPLEPV